MAKKKLVTGWRRILPRNQYGWVALIFGLLGSILYSTQLLFDWFGSDEIDKALFSIVCLIPIILGIASVYESNKNKSQSWNTVIKNTFKLFLLVFVAVILLNGVAMGMDTSFNDEANDSGLGIFYGLRLLSNVTSADVNNLAAWGAGLATIIRALFLIVPFLIAVWGGLSVLTADSIDEAEGGILAIVAAVIVVLIVWLFKLVEIQVG